MTENDLYYELLEVQRCRLRWPITTKLGILSPQAHEKALNRPVSINSDS